jgi:hypothetical protein
MQITAISPPINKIKRLKVMDNSISKCFIKLSKSKSFKFSKASSQQKILDVQTRNSMHCLSSQVDKGGLDNHKIWKTYSQIVKEKRRSAATKILPLEVKNRSRRKVLSKIKKKSLAHVILGRR